MNTKIIKYMPSKRKKNAFGTLKYLTDCPRLYNEVKEKINRKTISLDDLPNIYEFVIKFSDEFNVQCCAIIAYIIPLSYDILYNIFPKDIANVINDYVRSYAFFYRLDADRRNRADIFETRNLLQTMKVFDDYHELIQYINNFHDWHKICNTTEFAKFLSKISNKNDYNQ